MPEWGDATMISTRIYRLIPGAPADDHNGRRAAHQGELVVRARSSGEARAIAARAEAQAAGVRLPSTGQVLASAFADPVLYFTRLDDRGAFPDEGPVGVLAGGFRAPTGWVAHVD
jgi:hypothetical protein